MSEGCWYFAYGANMASEVLSRRRITSLEALPGRLDGYQLHFAVPGIPLIEPGFATVRPAQGALVHGVLHRLSEADLVALDGFEGEQCRLEVDVFRPDGTTVCATTYQSRRFAPGLKPSRRYKRLLVNGAREHGLPADWIAWLDSQPAVYIPVLSRFAPRLLGMLERLDRDARWFERLNELRFGRADPSEDACTPE